MNEPELPAATSIGSDSQASASMLEAPTHRSAPRPLLVPGPTSQLSCPPVLEDFEFVSEIARGGMGVVFLAKQRSLDRVVAVKMVLPARLGSPADVAQFRVEARAAANLQHPSIVRVFEVGEQEGQHYYTMEYIQGESLAERLRHGPLGANDAASLLIPVAEAVQHAHDRGVVHRDLKPGNILLDREGSPHVTDFGLATRGGRDSARPTGMAGTPSFMSPEQAGGREADVGPLSDVYSLGAVLYAAVTGRPPFEAASDWETTLLVLEQPPAPPSLLNRSIPRDIEAIAMKCLQKAPAARYRSARQVADDLRRFLAGEPVFARRGDWLYLARGWLRRNLLLAGISSLATGLLLAFTCLVALAYGAESRSRLALEAQLAELQGELAAVSAARRKVDQDLQEWRELGARQTTERLLVASRMAATSDPELANALLCEATRWELASPTGLVTELIELWGSRFTMPDGTTTPASRPATLTKWLEFARSQGARELTEPERRQLHVPRRSILP